MVHSGGNAPKEGAGMPAERQFRTAVRAELDVTCRAALTVPGMARMLVGLRLAEWGLDALVPDVCLIAAELVTNAVKSTPDREIRVRLMPERGSVLLGVWDASDEMPRVKPPVEASLPGIVPDLRALEPGHDDAGGRGLPIVAALASECRVSRTDPHGKWVWARVRTGK